MKIIALTFTCARDAKRAAFHQKFLPTHWRKIWCVESADKDIPAPEGTEILVRDFPRGGTLRGNAAIYGMRDVFLELAAECDLLVKLDSDTVLFRPQAWTAPFEYAGAAFTYIRRYDAESRLLANGCAYAVSRRALLRLRNFYEESEIPEKMTGHEDLIFSSFWTAFPRNRDLTLCQLDKDKFHWCAKPYYGADCLGAHLGYVSEADDFARCEAAGYFSPTEKSSNASTNWIV